MERLQELISQLKEQYERKEDPSQLLLTTRLLEAELTFMAGQSTVIRGSGSAKIAVMMPSSMKMYAGQHAVPETRASVADPRSTTVAGNGAAATVNGAVAPVNGVAATVNGAAVAGNGSAGNLNGTASVNGAVVDANGAMVAGNGAASAGNGTVVAGNVIAASGNGSATANGNGVLNGMTYDPLKDIPTLAHQPGSRELNDVIGNNGSSLNDRLKVDVMELAAALNDTPVRDLKKAIGVNDRYVFISQLFRGDEVMYERSIKTINGFRILPEAEYWMERELKVKLGWDENREATRHFYQLIKRRFS